MPRTRMSPIHLADNLVNLQLERCGIRWSSFFWKVPSYHESCEILRCCLPQGHSQISKFSSLRRIQDLGAAAMMDRGYTDSRETRGSTGHVSKELSFRKIFWSLGWEFLVSSIDEERLALLHGTWVAQYIGQIIWSGLGRSVLWWNHSLHKFPRHLEECPE